MNKFDRVISTLVLLQSKNLIKAREISDRYEISLRTVYRDISTLKNAGIPIIGDPGIGYSIMDGYRIPPIMFSEGEAASLLTAEKFIGQLTDKETQSYYSNAMMKIKAILRSSDKRALEILDDSISISHQGNYKNKPYLQDLFRGIASKLILKIQYQKADGTNSERKLEPIGCYHHDDNWYLVAYCQLKSDYRTFKVNRIVSLKVLDQNFETDHLSLKDYFDGKDQTWKDDHQFSSIEIVFKPSFLHFAEQRKHYFGFVDQQVMEDGVHMFFVNSSLELIARWLIQYGDQATVVAPEELKLRLKAIANQIYQHYN